MLPKEITAAKVKEPTVRAAFRTIMKHHPVHLMSDQAHRTLFQSTPAPTKVESCGEKIEDCVIGTEFIRDNFGGDSVVVKLPAGGMLHEMLGCHAALTIYPQEPTE
jgi:hypothetical protein